MFQKGFFNIGAIYTLKIWKNSLWLCQMFHGKEQHFDKFYKPLLSPYLPCPSQVSYFYKFNFFS